MELRLSTIITTAAKHAVKEQRSDGSFPPGSNGPYDDPETPVRTTSHWLYTLSRLCSQGDEFEVSSEERDEFNQAARKAIDYLTSQAARPSNATFRHRESVGKDECNGLIGQAWTIEALVEAGRTFDQPHLVGLAEEVFLLHPFDSKLGLWQRVDVDGTVLGYDRTFNHQLWFAAAGGELAQQVGGQVDEQMQRFLDMLSTLIDVDDCGLIRHLLTPEFSIRQYLGFSLDVTRRELCRNKLLGPIRPPSNRRTLRAKAIGYQSFNLYALAMLAERYPDHQVWEDRLIQQAIEFATSDAFRSRLADNPYGYPYNVSGFELAYALDVFERCSPAEQREWVEQQFRLTYDPTTAQLSRNNPDPETLTARLYEATRLSDLEIDVSGLAE